MAIKKLKAIAYLRTSSATNIGADRDSDKRQRAAVIGYAKANGFEIVAEYHDVVSGADPIGERAGFKQALEHIAGNGVRVILIESPDRFARDLAVQLAGHDYLKKLGIELIPASAPDYFTAETPTAVLVRQVLGAISEFEKATLVAKLRAARERKKATGARGEGRKSHAELRPAVVALAKQLRARHLSLREISAELFAGGHTAKNGRAFTPQSIANMVE